MLLFINIYRKLFVKSEIRLSLQNNLCVINTYFIRDYFMENIFERQSYVVKPSLSLDSTVFRLPVSFRKG